jgi:predicted ATPase
MAARLAMHFERGHELARAVWYHHLAAQQAMQRSGYQEAIGHLNHGLELLQRLPTSPLRAQQELAMQMAVGAALRATKAYGAPDVEHVDLRAREL